MIEATDRGYEIVAHVHDEMIIDVPRADQSAARDIDALMAEPIDWAPGLPLKGGTYECDYYMKD
jgi:DNA polymerase